MSTYYDPANLTWEGLKDAFVKERYKQETANGWAHKTPPICGTQEPPVQAMGGDVVPNIEFTYLCASSGQTIMNPIDYCTMQLRLEVNPSRSHAVCLVRYKAKAQLYSGSDAETDIYTIIGTSSGNRVFTDAYRIISPVQYYSPTDTNVSVTEINWPDNSITSRVGTDNFMRYNSVVHWSQPVTFTNSGYYMDDDRTVNEWISGTKATDESATEWRRLQQHSASKTGQEGHYCFTNNPTSSFYFYRNYFPAWACNIPSASSGYLYLMALSKLPDDIPLFDLNDGAEKIIAYLDRGDDSGRIDPFTPYFPEKTEVENFETDYKIFVTRDDEDPRKTHFSIIGYNDDFIDMGELGKDRYGVHVSVVDQQTQTGTAKHLNLGTTIQAMYPTMGVVAKIGYNYLFSLQFRNIEDPAQGDGIVQVGFEYKPTSAVNCGVVGANYMGNVMQRTDIVDGHRFTTADGKHSVDVLFRAVDIDDIGGRYDDEDDEDDNRTGTDNDYAGAGGLRTFTITSADFATINKKLWSTDWTHVFKSSSIDPVQCVITCKSIPFTASASSSDDITIANLNTGVHANYVKTVKTFDCGGVVIGYKRGDFTDFTHTHVRCYLPYIGWVELPAEEVISRRAYPEVGLSAHTKHLYFKYIVDFVDGSCRCIVSVGGTGEGRTDRWYFDGNCGVDMPVTSDNHTQAVSNALRSGVSTGLGVVSAIAGAVTGNAGAVGGGVMTALQNAPNMFPTYSFTATSNGSGYINSSMNQHIMIVVERANVQEPSGYTSRLGKPCNMVLPLGSLRGFTKCNNVDVSGINATPDELAMIKGLLESGVYL